MMSIHVLLRGAAIPEDFIFTGRNKKAGKNCFILEEESVRKYFLSRFDRPVSQQRVAKEVQMIDIDIVNNVVLSDGAYARC